MRLAAGALLIGALALPAWAQSAAPEPPAASTADLDALRQRIAAHFASAPAGTRFGLLVTDMAGRDLIAVNAGQRFVPASNTKLFVTAAALARRAAMEQAAHGTMVRLERLKGKRPDVVLIGRGDPLLSSADDCQQSCLATLADAVAAQTRQVGDIVGDDSWFADERWSLGMAWNNMPTRSGTGVSALTLDDNEVVVTLHPGTAGAPARIEGSGYYRVESSVATIEGAETRIIHWREPGDMRLRVAGTMGNRAPAQTLRLGIDDPAHYAAARMRALLEARGVHVRGVIRVRHRPWNAKPDMLPTEDISSALAALPMPPVGPTVVTVNKISQNVHAGLLLRRLGRIDGDGSVSAGLAALDAVMAEAGVPRDGYAFFDGAGMSTYNRLSPRAAASLLRWIAGQPWGAEWRASLPVAGQDGTLRGRFAGTTTTGQLSAKTGTLNAAAALSGYMTARSGRALIVSLFANDFPDDAADQAVAVMDDALGAIAEAL